MAVGWLPLGSQYDLTREADKKTSVPHSELNTKLDITGHITKPGSNQ